MPKMFSTNLGTSGGAAAPTNFQQLSKAARLALSPADGDMVYDTTQKILYSYVLNMWRPVFIDPRYGVPPLYEDFVSGTTTYAQNWAVTGTVSAGLGGTATLPGRTLIRAAAANARSSLTLRSDAILLGTADVYIEWSMQFPTLATALEDYCVAFGLNDASAYDANSAATDGAYFTYNRAVNGANWNTHTASNGSLTNTTNIVSAISANTTYRLGIMVNAGTSVEFFVNGTLVATHTTNIPTGAGRMTGYQARVDKSAGTGNSDINLDYFYSYMIMNGARA